MLDRDPETLGLQELSEHFGCVDVVIDHQKKRFGPDDWRHCRRWSGMAWAIALHRQTRQANRELAAFVMSPALRRRTATVEFDQAPDDRRTEAKATLSAGEGSLPLHEQSEHFRKQLCRDADAVVRNVDHDMRPGHLQTHGECACLAGQ